MHRGVSQAASQHRRAQLVAGLRIAGHSEAPMKWRLRILCIGLAACGGSSNSPTVNGSEASSASGQASGSSGSNQTSGSSTHLDQIYVASAGDGTVKIYSGSSYALLKTLAFSADADNLRYDAAADKVWVGYGGATGGVAS
jgi:hypothetical protein